MLEELKNNSCAEANTNQTMTPAVDATCDCFECYLESTCNELN